MPEAAPAAPPANTVVRWTNRRRFTIAVTVASMALVAVIVFRTDHADVLKAIGLALCGVVTLMSFFYVGGATMTDIWRVIAAMRGVATSLDKEPS